MGLPQVTTMELQSIRHLISEEMLAMSKCQAYAQECDDPQAKQLINACMTEHQQRAQTLLKFLQ